MKRIVFALAVVVLGCLVVACAARPNFTGEQMRRMQSSSNYADGKFRNPTGLSADVVVSYPSMIFNYLFGEGERFPRTPPVVEPLNPLAMAEGSSLKVAWLGHSTVLLNVEGVTVLTDPVFSKRVSPFSFAGPSRFHDRLAIEPDRLPSIDVVVISHDHYDHLDRAAIETLHPRVGCFYVPLGVGAYLAEWGVPKNKIVELDWWEEAQHPSGLTLACTPSHHFSGRGIFGRNTTLWCSWSILGKEERVYFSGDSGYSSHFREIGEKYGPFDLTLMESGAYSEYWPYAHMQPEQSVQAHLDVGGKVMLPIHWGTFNLALHDWDEPIRRVMDRARQTDVPVLATVSGRVVELSPGRFETAETSAPELRMEIR
ncbi:MBL fold metallo-hydrolase [Salidesulfovibrio onnuriiensis]|uniref:MBL fold metallo-hydrolase n=1 Tax=Salidesulfovibrio onnuriiensis TaxID=2583823 RepID=UPI00165032C7|nr:MBL fold metallo-hydrolase [Salidesulfovibrio onnuriiensis]